MVTLSADIVAPVSLVPEETQNLPLSTVGSATLVFSESENGSKFGEEQPSVGI
jgi:hypothetical protein